MDDLLAGNRRYVGRYPGTLAPTFSVTSPTATPERRDGARVLVVDDDPYFRSFLQMMLKQAGLKIGAFAEVADSQGAISICGTRSFDIIFCDLNLQLFKSKNGIDVVQELRRFDAKVPIFMVTAENSGSVIEQVCEAGASGHILKPVNLRTLKRVLKLHLHDLIARSEKTVP